MRSTFGRLPVVAVAGAILLAACGSSGTTTPQGGGGSAAPGSITATQVPAVAAEVPNAIRTKGTLTIAADATYAPNEFIGPDGTTVVGMDADLGKALGQVLGLSVTVTNVKFDNILPGIQAGKYDLGMSSFTDTKEREQVVDFVTYFSAGTSFFVKKNGPTINTVADLCGHNVAVESGTTQESDSNAQKPKCPAGTPLNVLSFPDQNGANLALQSGRADVGMSDSPVADYAVQQSNGQFQITGQTYGTAPYGIAIPKGNGMAQAVLDALKELMKDGVYNNILTKWNIQSGAINNPAINQGS